MRCSRTAWLFGFAFLAVSLCAPTATPGFSPVQLYEKGMNALIGPGVNRSDLNATEYIRRSSERGYAPAQVTLGYFYETGTILTREPEQAARWYKKAAQQDDLLGEWLPGRAVFTGQGTMRDLKQAANCLLKSVSHGDPFSQYHWHDPAGTERHYTQAAEWFRKAANQGLPQARQHWDNF